MIELKLNVEGEGAAFVPLLEHHFKDEVIVHNENVKELLEYYRSTYLNLEDWSDENSIREFEISMGLDVWDGEKYLFMWKVSDMLELIKSFKFDMIQSSGTIILCNLVTHFQEVQKLGFESELIYPINTDSRLPELRRRSDLPKWTPEKSEVIVNPTSYTNMQDLINAHTFVKYYEAGYNWNDNNYSNEYCEIHHLANIFGARVKSAITRTELDVTLALSRK